MASAWLQDRLCQDMGQPGRQMTLAFNERAALLAHHKVSRTEFEEEWSFLYCLNIFGLYM